MTIDKGTNLPITQLSGLQINYKDSNSCLNPPIVTTIERNALINSNDPANKIKPGTIVYNSDDNAMQVFQGGAWVALEAGGAGGDVSVNGATVVGNLAKFNTLDGKLIADSGIALAEVGTVKTNGATVVGNLACFDGITGKLIADSGINVVPIAKISNEVNATPLYRLSNLAALQFGSNNNVADTGVILVDSLTPITFQTQGTGVDAQVCTVINGELGAGSSSPSALLEINNTTGAFLPSRLTTEQRDALITPQDGYVLYNTTDKKLNVRENGFWVEYNVGTGSSNYREVLTNYTLLPTDDILNCRIYSGSITITISKQAAGKIYTFFIGNKASSSYVVNLAGAEIDGKNGFTLSSSYQSLSIISDGTNWMTISQSNNNVIGPLSSIENNIPTFDNTTGTLIKDSGISISSLSNRANARVYNTRSANTGIQFPASVCKVTLIGSGGAGGKAQNGYMGCGGGAGATVILYLRNLTSNMRYHYGVDDSILSNTYFGIFKSGVGDETYFTLFPGGKGSDGSSSITIGGTGGTVQTGIATDYPSSSFTSVIFNGASGGVASNSGVSGAGGASTLGGNGASVVGNQNGQSAIQNSGSGGSGGSGSGIGGNGCIGLIIIEY